MGIKLDFQYLREIGASNLGLIQINGTVSAASGSNSVIGNGTSFTSDYYVGGFIL